MFTVWALVLVMVHVLASRTHATEMWNFLITQLFIDGHNAAIRWPPASTVRGIHQTLAGKVSLVTKVESLRCVAIHIETTETMRCRELVL